MAFNEDQPYRGRHHRLDSFHNKIHIILAPEHIQSIIGGFTAFIIEFTCL